MALAIDLTAELPLVRLRDVPTLAIVGPRRGGGRMNVRTPFRWATRGCGGVVLQTVLQCGVRYTTLPALQRFFAAVTAARDRARADMRQPGPDRQCTDPTRVEAELNRLGL